MTEALEDWEAWDRYPQHRWIFDKLTLATCLGHSAGPTPLPVPVTGEYVVRPIYNLSGMAIGAKIMTLEAGVVYDFPPSYFWCERFIGDHLSVNYEWQGKEIIETHTSLGETDYTNLSRFKRWTHIENRNIPLPDWIEDFSDVGSMNIEFVDNHIVEIHLRPGVDFPDGAIEIVPVWSTTSQEEVDMLLSQGYLYKENYMDAEKNIPDPRLGFLYK